MTDIQTGIPLYALGDRVRLERVILPNFLGSCVGIMKQACISRADILTVTHVDCDFDGYVFISVVNEFGAELRDVVQERFVRVDENGNDI